PSNTHHDKASHLTPPPGTEAGPLPALMPCAMFDNPAGVPSGGGGSPFLAFLRGIPWTGQEHQRGCSEGTALKSLGLREAGLKLGGPALQILHALLKFRDGFEQLRHPPL